MIVVVALRGGVLARQHSRLWSMNSRFSEWTHDFDAARRLNIHPARPNKGKEDGRRLSSPHNNFSSSRMGVTRTCAHRPF